MDSLSPEEIRHAVRAALAEDIGSGDVTTLATISETARARAAIAARQALVVAGLDFAEMAIRELGPDSRIERLVKDGHRAERGEILLQVTGRTRALLTAERVALNFLQRLSGVATLTAAFVDALQGTKAKILDTRKTTPGWRRFEKYAVVCGGGRNHRHGLFDMVLIKDNHLVALRHEPPNPIEAAVRRARARYPGLKIEVEADTLKQVEEAVTAGVDIILLDNMSVDEMRTAVQSVHGRALCEASGGVNLATVRAIAGTGVDLISVGALTHSAPAVDIAMDFLPD